MSYAAAMNPKYRDVFGPKKNLIFCVPWWLYTPAAISRGAKLCQTELIQLLSHRLFTSLSVGLQATNFPFPSHQLFKGHGWCEDACPQLKVGQISWADRHLLWHSLLQLKERKNVDGRLNKIK